MDVRVVRRGRGLWLIAIVPLRVVAGVILLVDAALICLFVTSPPGNWW
jgi:hypothetical protein